MGHKIYSTLLLLLLSACASRPNSKNIPQYTYVDSIRTERVINCASRIPLDCMACALQGEAANQTANGIYAVGVTIMTRANGHLDKICKTTKARRQFEGMKGYGNRKISKKVMGVAKHIIKSRETGWTHFWAPQTQTQLNRGKPHWAHTFEKRQCHNEKIDDHIFFNTKQCKYNQNMRMNAQND